MTNFVVFLICFLLIFSCFCVFVIINQIKKIKSMGKTINSIVEANNNLHDELKKIYEVEKIKSDNRKDSNEKINNLHNGDATGNAINILCNNKNK